MGLFIRNAEVERKARELAVLTGDTLTGALGKALDVALEHRRTQVEPENRAERLAKMIAATEEFRRAVGLDKRKVNATKADFDALWEIPGVTDRPNIP